MSILDNVRRGFEGHLNCGESRGRKRVDGGKSVVRGNMLNECKMLDRHQSATKK